MKRNCMECKNCILKKMPHTKGYSTHCMCEDKIAQLSMKELELRIVTGTCDFYAAGIPVKGKRNN